MGDQFGATPQEAMQTNAYQGQLDTLWSGTDIQPLRSSYEKASRGRRAVVVIFGMRKAGKDDEEVQDYPHLCHSITSYEIRVMALRSEMEFRIGIRHEWGEKLYAKRDEILYEEQGFVD